MLTDDELQAIRGLQCDGDLRRCVTTREAVVALLDALAEQTAALEAMKNLTIPVELFCLHCGHQHVDAPEPDTGWTNPPHRRHLCHGCGATWQPYPVGTRGVRSVDSAKLVELQAVVVRLLDAMQASGNVGGAMIAWKHWEPSNYLNGDILDALHETTRLVGWERGS